MRFKMGNIVPLSLCYCDSYLRRRGPWPRRRDPPNSNDKPGTLTTFRGFGIMPHLPMMGAAGVSVCSIPSVFARAASLLGAFAGLGYRIRVP
jgi:hypothetical protein